MLTPPKAPSFGSMPILDSFVPAAFRTGATYPVKAWRPDLFSLLALGEMGGTGWQGITGFVEPKPFDHPDVIQEFTTLVAMARDERAALAEEIYDQNNRLHDYFHQVLMLSPEAHPSTIKLLEMAARTGEMVGMHFKQKYMRARPQQVFPGLVPLVAPPAHPSFPSGHSLESHMMAQAMADVRPFMADALTALADRIGRNREVAGVHFPSDTAAGRVIARAAYPLLKTCPTYAQVLAEARKETT